MGPTARAGYEEAEGVGVTVRAWIDTCVFGVIFDALKVLLKWWGLRMKGT